MSYYTPPNSNTDRRVVSRGGNTGSPGSPGNSGLSTPGRHLPPGISPSLWAAMRANSGLFTDQQLEGAGVTRGVPYRPPGGGLAKIQSPPLTAGDPRVKVRSPPLTAGDSRVKQRSPPLAAGGGRPSVNRAVGAQPPPPQHGPHTGGNQNAWDISSQGKTAPPPPQKPGPPVYVPPGGGSTMFGITDGGPAPGQQTRQTSGAWTPPGNNPYRPGGGGVPSGPGNPFGGAGGGSNVFFPTHDGQPHGPGDIPLIGVGDGSALPFVPGVNPWRNGGPSRFPTPTQPANAIPAGGAGQVNIPNVVDPGLNTSDYGVSWPSGAGSATFMGQPDLMSWMKKYGLK